MGHARDITVKQVWSSEAISASTGVTSAAFDLGSYADNLNVSLQVEVAGTGVTVNFDYLISNDGSSYMVPSTATYGSSIVGSFTSTSGTHGDGKDVLDVSPVLGRFVKLSAHEISGITATTISAWLAMQ